MSKLGVNTFTYTHTYTPTHLSALIYVHICIYMCMHVLTPPHIYKKWIKRKIILKVGVHK